MTQATKTSISVVILFLIAIPLIVWSASLNMPTQIIYVQDPNYVQCPSEAQERLKAQGFYHGKIDGIWGEQSDRAFCDWCAVQEFRRWEQKCTMQE